MNAGIIHARKLGISDFYIDSCLRRRLTYRQSPKQQYVQAQQRSPQGLNHLQGQSKTAGNGLPDGPSRVWHEKRQLLYTSFEHSRDIDADSGYREGRSRRESTPSRSSSTNAEDKKARHLKHQSSEDTSDSEIGPYYPEDGSRYVGWIPRMSASTVKDNKKRQIEIKGSKTTCGSTFDPNRLKGQSRHKSRRPISITAAADDQTRRRSRHRRLEGTADMD